MKHITDEVSDLNKKVTASSANSTGNSRTRDTCKNCGKKGHTHRECRAESSCFRCKAKGHRQFDCPSLKKDAKGVPALQQTAIRSATVVSDEPASPSTVAAVMNSDGQLQIDTPFAKIVDVNDILEMDRDKWNTRIQQPKVEYEGYHFHLNKSYGDTM